MVDPIKFIQALHGVGTTVATTKVVTASYTDDMQRVFPCRLILATFTAMQDSYHKRSGYSMRVSARCVGGLGRCSTYPSPKGMGASPG